MTVGSTNFTLSILYMISHNEDEEFEKMLDEVGELSMKLIDRSISIRNLGIGQVEKARKLGELICQLQHIYRERKLYLKTGMRWKAFITSQGYCGLDYTSTTYYKLIYLNWDIITKKGWDKTKTYSQLIHQILPAYKHQLKNPVSEGEFEKMIDDKEAAKQVYQRVSQSHLRKLEENSLRLDKYMDKFGNGHFLPAPD